MPLRDARTLADFFSDFGGESAAYSIPFGQTRLDFEFQRRDPSALAVFFHGAVDKDKIKSPPAFSGRSIAAKVKASCLYVSDPSFYLSDDLTIGWYGGSRDVAAQTVIADVLAHIRRTLSVTKTVFFGGSAGGFASLYFSRTMADATAIVWNPQTILENYYAHLVENYARIAFGTSREELHRKIETNVAALYAQPDTSNTVVYLQNITDTHVEAHLSPFLDGIGATLPRNALSGWVKPRTYLHLSDWSQGHTPPPRAALRTLLERLSEPGVVNDAQRITSAVAQAAAVGDGLKVMAGA